MKWSWKIGSVAGIGIYMHATFLILLGWLGLSHYLVRHNWQDALNGIGFILCLFGIVVLHELGHALMARRYGIRTRDITLLPIGGVARLDRIPEKPMQELFVALAGPAVNVLLAGLLAGALALGHGLAAMTDVKLLGGDLLTNLLWVNVSLAVFNLLPAFPMDGGRVLRALLAMRMERERATDIAARIGQAMAWVFGFVGFFTNPFLIFIALFVWMGAAQEASLVQMKSALSGISVGKVMIKNCHALAPHDSLGVAVEHIVSGCQHDFAVVEENRLVGVLTRADLLDGLARHGDGARVEDVMQRQFQTTEPEEMIEHVLGRLQQDDCRTIPVLQNGELAGLFNLEHLGEFLL
ncbi:MAG TPA: site-2 protease family protein, partial [Candidatus Angelobacter sp.]|nr:site-2 protease family protein [Candidatus Angelobacter sp.]